MRLRAFGKALLAMLLGCTLARGDDPPPLPGPALEVAVDMDGDGRDTFGDRYAFNWWLEQGGSLGAALSNAEPNGELIDLSVFFETQEAQLTDTGLMAPLDRDGQQQFCPPPDDHPYHTRRIPPDRPLDGPSLDPRMTPDGRFIVFASNASNLPQANGEYQIYRYEQGAQDTTAVIICVSGGASQDCTMPSISDDGTRVVFQTRAYDFDPFDDIYMAEVNDGSVTRLCVSEPYPGHWGEHGDSYGAAISGNGRFVAFTSEARDLLDPQAPEDVNGAVADVFRYDADTGEMILVSRNYFGVQSNYPFSTTGEGAIEGWCARADLVEDLRVGRIINEDGSRILMHGRPCDFCNMGPADDPKNCPDTHNSHDQQGAADCVDGGPDPGDKPGRQQVYVAALVDELGGLQWRTYMLSAWPWFADGTIHLIAGDDCSRRSSITRDGTWVVFSSPSKMFGSSAEEQNLEYSDQAEDVFICDVQAVMDAYLTAPTDRVLYRLTPPWCGSGVFVGDSFQPIVTVPAGAPNRPVTIFASKASRLLGMGLGNPCPDTNGDTDIFICQFDVAAEQIVSRVRFSVDSAGKQSDGDSMNPDTSGDGRIALYESEATNLLGAGGDPNGLQDIFQSPSPQGPFIRGDVDLNGAIEVTDAIFIGNWLYQGGPPPGCYDAADADDTGQIVVTDMNFILNFLFQGGAAPPCPYCCAAKYSCCGKDPTGDSLPCGVTLQNCTEFGAQGECE